MEKLALIMAAGEGTRMLSNLPKVLHAVCGQPIVEHVLRAVDSVCKQKVLIVGHGKERIMEACHGQADFVEQQPGGWGTGHAIRSAASMLEGKKGAVLITAGDMPLVLPETYARLMSEVEKGYAAAMLTDHVDNPTGYGRVVRENGKVCAIVEQKDLVGEHHNIKEMNASVYCFDIEALLWALPQLKNNNGAHEYYLTDVINILYKGGREITTVPVLEKSECCGINNRLQLAQAEREMRRRINARHMREGVTMIDPEATYIEPDVSIGRDTVVYPGCVLQKGTIIGENCLLLPNCRIMNSVVGDNVRIENSVLLDARVGDGSTVGPFAYIRPDTVVGEKCRVGDFVELKNSNIGDGTKISHLTYVGDSDVGEKVNLGCGVVFVNYDGKNKNRSSVGDGAFVGCNVNLVSPVNVGSDAYIAAGSTITEDVPDGAMAIARERQSIKEDWVSKRKMEGKL